MFRATGKFIVPVCIAMLCVSPARADDEKAQSADAEKNAAKAEMFFVKGHKALDRVDGPAAEANYRKAIALAPGVVKYHRQLGVLLLEGKRGQEAERELLIAVSLDPDDWKSLLALGTFYHRARRYDEEVTTYKKLLTLLPLEHKGLRDRLIVYIQRDEIAVKETIEKEKRKREEEEKKYKHLY